MLSVSTSIDADLRRALDSRYQGLLVLPDNFEPSKKWAHLAVLLEALAFDFEPQIRWLDSCVWAIKIAGACEVFADNGQLQRAVVTAFLNSLCGVPTDDKSNVSDARADRCDEPLSGSGPAPVSRPELGQLIGASRTADELGVSQGRGRGIPPETGPREPRQDDKHGKGKS